MIDWIANALNEQSHEIDGDWRGRDFAVTLIHGRIDGLAIFGGGNLAQFKYCIYDRVQQYWAVYQIASAAARFDPNVVRTTSEHRLSTDEESRWVSFQSVVPARVTEFYGDVAIQELDRSNFDATYNDAGTELIPGPYYFALSHPNFPRTQGFLPYAADAFGWRSVAVLSPQGVPTWNPAEHCLNLHVQRPRGRATGIGLAGVGRGLSIVIDSGKRRERTPWQSFSPPG